MLSPANLVIIAFVISVAFFDASIHKIPRFLTTSGFVLGLAFHLVWGGFAGALLAAAVGFSFGLLFFRLGAIGGGDVKLITALGALLGWHLWTHAMYIAVLAAALIALLIAAYQKALLRTLRNAAELISSIPRNGLVPQTGMHVKNPLSVRGPFGVAAAIGTIAVLVRA